MRQHVAFLTMALVAFAAGSARANDATQLVYDLSALRAPRVLAPAAASRSADYRLPTSSLPLATPSLNRTIEGGTDYSGDDLEVRRPNHNGHVGTGVGSPRNPGNGNPDPRQPAPTPEPGTMMLLGGALASGARFIRRRRNG